MFFAFFLKQKVRTSPLFVVLFFGIPPRLLGGLNDSQATNRVRRGEEGICRESSLSPTGCLGFIHHGTPSHTVTPVQIAVRIRVKPYRKSSYVKESHSQEGHM
jgi:hypothetical protein